MTVPVELREVTKVFSRPGKAVPSSWLRRLFSSESEKYVAVSGLSFSLREGEILGFIGPNGAGKSTTLKMLAGILQPTSGEVRVMGLDPMRHRDKVAKHIAAVFGQKSQLWIHLPAIDSFKILGEVYGLSGKETLSRIEELSKALALTPFLNVPVRKLSLGERIRCEIAASLIHLPDVLFLDEPTIGLDIDARRSMREHIVKLNATFKTTIILTSHDLVDIEKLCTSVIIINKGVKVYHGSIDELRARYLHIKQVRIRASGLIPADLLPPAVRVLRNDTVLEFEVDTEQVPLAECLRKLISGGFMDDITIHDRPLEDIILSIYKSEILKSDKNVSSPSNDAP